MTALQRWEAAVDALFHNLDVGLARILAEREARDEQHLLQREPAWAAWIEPGGEA